MTSRRTMTLRASAGLRRRIAETEAEARLSLVAKLLGCASGSVADHYRRCDGGEAAEAFRLALRMASQSDEERGR